ncbi:Threonine dehydrogenase and related Zn-dependent dehydrogenases, partial [hydrothermal vent metagenome]
CFVLNLLHPDLSLVGKHEDKLRIAGGQNVKTILLDNLEMEKSYDTVVESTGSADGFEMALKLVRPGGTVVLKSTVAKGRKINLAPLVIDEITVVGSRCGPFKPALRALERKIFDVRPLITGIFTFDRAKEAFEKAEEKGSLKVIIDFR